MLLAARALLSELPFVSSWRTLTLAACGFPDGLSSFPAGKISTTPRSEWSMWKSLRQQRLKRLPAFGDYTIQYPDRLTFDPKLMSFSAQLRYTSDEEWLILKGNDVRKKGYEQFNELCRQLIKRAEYCGADFSWGDFYIHKCSNNQDGPGNATTWRQVGTTHHIQFVIRQLANRARAA